MPCSFGSDPDCFVVVNCEGRLADVCPADNGSASLTWYSSAGQPVSMTTCDLLASTRGGYLNCSEDAPLSHLTVLIGRAGTKRQKTVDRYIYGIRIVCTAFCV